MLGMLLLRSLWQRYISPTTSIADDLMPTRLNIVKCPGYCLVTSAIHSLHGALMYELNCQLQPLANINHCWFRTSALQCFASFSVSRFRLGVHTAVEGLR